MSEEEIAFDHPIHLISGGVMEEVTCERGLGVWAEYQPNMVQVRGEVPRGAVGDEAGRSGSKPAGLPKTEQGICTQF